MCAEEGAALIGGIIYIAKLASGHSPISLQHHCVGGETDSLQSSSTTDTLRVLLCDMRAGRCLVVFDSIAKGMLYS